MEFDTASYEELDTQDREELVWWLMHVDTPLIYQMWEQVKDRLELSVVRSALAEMVDER